MVSGVEVVERQDEYTLEINGKASMMMMSKVIGKGYEDIYNYMKKNEIPCEAPPYIKYVNFSWDDVEGGNKFLGFLKMFTKKWDMEMGFPVKKEYAGEGIIKSGKIAGGKYLQTMHKGPYQKVGSAYKLLMAYMKENKLKAKEECMEIYLNDPKMTKKEDLETIVLIPLK